MPNETDPSKLLREQCTKFLHVSPLWMPQVNVIVCVVICVITLSHGAIKGMTLNTMCYLSYDSKLKKNKVYAYL